MFNDESNIVIKEEPMYQPNGCSCVGCDLNFCDVQEVKWHVQQEGCRYSCSVCGQDFDTKLALISHGKWPNSCDNNLFEDSCDFDVLEPHFKTFYKTDTKLTLDLPKISAKDILRTESANQQTIFTSSVTQWINSEPLCDGEDFIDMKEENDAKTQQVAAYHMQLEILSFSKKKKRKKFRRRRNRHGTKTHQCMICGRMFAKPQYLKLHLRRHTAIKPYPCDKCERRFSKKVALENHMRVHTGLQPYKCDECGKPFSNYGHLRRHLRAHLTEEVYKCNHCNLHFLYRYNLEYHLRVHATDKSYHCEQYEQCISIKSDMDSHSSLHNQKPYECNDCGQCFSLKRDLVKHTKCHIREKILSVIF